MTEPETEPGGILVMTVFFRETQRPPLRIEMPADHPTHGLVSIAGLIGPLRDLKGTVRWLSANLVEEIVLEGGAPGVRPTCGGGHGPVPCIMPRGHLGPCATEPGTVQEQRRLGQPGLLGQPSPPR